jgi:Glycosyltransferase family 9 (heptosyltransferase)
VGYGDEIIASGLARGAHARGKRIAFGDGRRIVWSRQSHIVFANNPNVAPPGAERDGDIEWIEHYKGRRLYGEAVGGHWRFRDFRCPPGEIYFSDYELARMAKLQPAPVIIEPTVKDHGACAGANKQWPVERYLVVAQALSADGEITLSLGPSPRHEWPELPRVETPDFRDALAVLARARLYIGPEGGMHHAAAALGVPAVVIFGGFNSPKSTGYPWHSNLTVGEPCGSIGPCEHCRQAMAQISVERVIEAARAHLKALDATASKRKIM